MNDPGEIEARLSAVEAVGSLVHAMLALARAQLPAADAAAAEATQYLDQLDTVVRRLANPVETTRDRLLTVVLGPERPLCGSLPRRVATMAGAEANGAIGVVGRRALDACHALGLETQFAVPGPHSTSDLPDVTRALASELLAHASDCEILLLHPLQGSSTLHRSTLLGSWVLAPNASPTLSPAHDVLEHAIREATTARLQVALAETLRVEIAARVLAGEGARRAMLKKQETLRAEFRVARHEQITNEILDLSRARRSVQ